MKKNQSIPVILDTDIGGDIDDTWALAMMLKSPELEPRLIVSDTGDTEYRARIIAKLLEVAGRVDVPIGVGLPFASDGPRERQRPWVSDYALGSYPGVVHRDGIQALIDTIMQGPDPVTLICIGPAPNIEAALQREPRIAGKTHLVGMYGSFAVHHATNLNNRVLHPGAIAEFNVKCAVSAAQALFSAPWLSLTITPLDSCGFIMFEGEQYARLRDSNDPLMRAVIENYRIWSPGPPASDPESHSSVLFDAVAVYLAFTHEHLRMETLPVRVDDCGFTIKDPAARSVQVAMGWNNLDAFYEFLATRLCAPTLPAGVMHC